MGRGWRAIPMALFLLPGLLGAPDANAPRAQGASGGTPVATVGDDVITLEELEEPLAAQLAELEQKRHQLLSERLEHLIGERLLAQEAKRRGISLEELLKSEVYARAREVTEAEVATFMRQKRARLPRGADEADLRLKVWDYLRSRRVSARCVLAVSDRSGAPALARARRFGVPTAALERKLRGSYTDQNIPGRLKVVEDKTEDLCLHLSIETHTCQLREEGRQIGQRPWPDARNGRWRGKTAGSLLEQDDVA